MKTRHTFLATLLVALLAVAGVTAAIAADPADPPPPRIAFLANGRVPADALAAGPIAGQLGAPVYTTEQDTLPDSTADALDDYNPELVIVMGGSVAISDAVVAAVSSATGLPVVDPTPPPTTGVVRAAGADRFVTATVVADLLGAYDPAYLGVDLQAIDADLLDGKDSSAFQPAGNYLGENQKASDSDKLDGLDSSSFLQAQDPLGAMADTGNVNSHPADGTDVEIASLVVAAGDPCGGGTTLTHFALDAAGFVEAFGVDGEYATTRIWIGVDSSTTHFDPGFSLTRVAPVSGSMYENLTARRIVSLAPGDHAITLSGDISSGTLAANFREFTLSALKLGYSCDGSSLATTVTRSPRGASATGESG